MLIGRMVFLIMKSHIEKDGEGIGLSYPATVFAVGELGVCSRFLDDDIVPQIKNGWIHFRRLN